MNSKELIKALDNLVAEKNISPDVVFEALQLALQTAYKKNFNSKTNVGALSVLFLKFLQFLCKSY